MHGAPVLIPENGRKADAAQREREQIDAGADRGLVKGRIVAVFGVDHFQRKKSHSERASDQADGGGDIKKHHDRTGDEKSKSAFDGEPVSAEHHERRKDQQADKTADDEIEKAGVKAKGEG